MPAQFNVNSTEVTEFGVGLDDRRGERYVLVPVDGEVQGALREMVLATRSELKDLADDAEEYDPSEKYSGQERLRLPLDSDLATHLVTIHNANNLNSEPGALADPSRVFCYFVRLIDNRGRRLTAIRRATGFKGILKNRLISFTTDALKLVPGNVFKLDHDFDLLIDDTGIEILRPAGFEFVGQLEGAILSAVPKNIKSIKADLPWVNFDAIESYAAQHPRAARYLASIRAQQETKNIDKPALKKQCKSTGVKVQEVNGQLVVDPGSILDFLGVLDRRLYEVELVKGSPESFRASSRSKINP